MQTLISTDLISNDLISTDAECSSQNMQESRLTAGEWAQLSAAGIVVTRPGLVSGAVVFAGTRVPVYNLWDYLSGGDSIDDFLESFPTVHREQVEQAIDVVLQRSIF